ncbi:MAG: Undecaprenyl-diphosphatase [Phycisphaerae bacterium]|nr:Undecaprenyl-diphosphatase [Phycisphaerae bacterium]
MRTAVVLVLLLVLIAGAAPAPTSAPTSQPDTAAAQVPARPITPLQAVVMGIVEGVTEYLPVSSTGHLILAGHFLGLPDSDAVKAFEIVIQVGAILAVLGLYRRRVGQMLCGLVGRDRGGLKLFVNLLIAFLPAAVIGLATHNWIKAHLFAPWPVIAALAAGGVLMIAVDRLRRWPGVRMRAVTVDTMTWRIALVVGLAQVLAMWPGTSRSMITIVAAILAGMEIKSAAEFSFLLGLPTLAGASLFDSLKHGGEIVHAAGPLGLLLGLVVSWVVAVIAVKAFVAWLNRHGLSPFGYYRIALAGLFVVMTLLVGIKGF